ncbi:cytochrome P450 [Actinoalloteichus sp. GBA129-24]|uniref:cytochrome P450 n=1 Tax=Actinoalloteichus sp. GBA129-24 TaxID=1612551 RepID=UPI000950A630|nr:cytochrome P450 [Actinoalloteichus sp. GBA129-24]APU19353.1 cytochrome P450 [Actinoalloteichus sp. GBA129-24]
MPLPTLPFDRLHPLAPPPAYADLRDRAPIAAVTAEDGQPAWLVTSYDAASTVLGDPRFGVSRPGDPRSEDATLLTDGEPHARLRRLVGKTFTRRRIAALRPRVEAHAAALADRLAHGDQPADLVADFAAPLSITVISELLGVDIAERDRFRRLADAAGAADFLSAEGDREAAQQAWREFGEYVGGLVAAKREEQADDLLSALITAHERDDDQLTDGELTTLALTILASGYLTATNAVSVGALVLIDEGRLAAFPIEPAAIDAVVEEVVRLQIALIGEVFPRWAHEAVELGGVTIRAGDRVLVRLGAANRDPARFDQPDSFRPGRSAGHLAFGRGPHHCLGAALARLEIGAALHALAQRLPTLALRGSIDDVSWSRSHADAGPTAVHVIW